MVVSNESSYRDESDSVFKRAVLPWRRVHLLAKQFARFCEVCFAPLVQFQLAGIPIFLSESDSSQKYLSLGIFTHKFG